MGEKISVFFQSLQVQIVEAKSQRADPSDLSRSQVLKAGQQLRRLQDQLAGQEELQSGLERENEALRRVNQSCKEELDGLTRQLERERVKMAQQRRRQEQVEGENVGRMMHNRILEVREYIACLLFADVSKIWRRKLFGKND